MSEGTVYDIIVIGGGPAGFTSSIYTARGGLKTVQISLLTGGQIGVTPVIENYPGIKSITGLDYVDIIREQALEWGVELMEAEQATKIVVEDKLRRVITDGDEYLGKAVIIATGREHKKLEVPGNEIYEGRGISYCATCDGAFYKQKDVAVIGGGDTALTDAIYLTALAKNVHVIHRRDELRAEAVLERQFVKNPAANIHWDTIVTEFVGKEFLTGLRLKNVKTNNEEILPIDGAFIAIGANPQSQIAETCGIELNEFKEIIVNNKQETNISGVFAAGDVTPGVRQVATAVGEGASAAIYAQEYLNRTFE